jgi:hyaluronan synthase
MGHRRLGGDSGSIHTGGPVLLATRKVTPGALSPHYQIPACSLRRRDNRGITFTVLMLAGIAARFGLFVTTYPGFWLLDAVILIPLLSMGFQWIMSWRDKPVPSNPAAAVRLARLRVVVNVPVYNEDAALLDRCLWALLNQSRPPQRVDVVDDGSTVSYGALREHWEGRWPCGTEIRWARQENQGKKHAQAVTFASSPDADIYVIIDSDTCLEHRALEEGLRPFADRGVASVAGIELAMNAAVNWLTRTVSVRALFFQMLPCAAQSALGDVLINRGAFFLIRAAVVREYLDAYLNETFLGRPIRLGDDAALTLFARSRGKTVQQCTAFGLTMYPETLSHHLRQWVRWMRGSTIRTCWRLRYLSPATFGWWFTVMGVYSLLVSTAFPVMLVLMWPRSERAVEYVIMVTLLWGYVYGLRSLAVRRSDQSRWFQVVSLLAYPSVLLWGLLVLRPLRFYGTCTFLKQGWVTRVNGAEIVLAREVALEGVAA